MLNKIVRDNGLSLEIEYGVGKYDTTHCHYIIKIEDTGETIIDMDIRYPVDEYLVVLNLTKILRQRKLDILLN